MKMCKMNYFSLFWKSYLVLFLTFIIAHRLYVAPLVQEAVVQRCKRTTKSFHLMKIRAKSVEICAKSLKPSRNPCKSEQTTENMNKNGAQRRPKEHEELLFRRSEFFLGHVWENSGKNPSHPQKLACSLLHHHRFRDFLILFQEFLELHL